MAKKKTDDSNIDATVAAPAPARWPHVMDVQTAAEFLSVSPWTVRAWAAAGILPVVAFPGTPAREGEAERAEMRRTLFLQTNLTSMADAHRRKR